MSEQADRLKGRTHAFYVRVIALCEALPNRPAPPSKKEFIAKLGIAIEEIDESQGWLEALQASRLADPGELASLIKESDELTTIFVASRKTAELNLEREKRAGLERTKAMRGSRDDR